MFRNLRFYRMTSPWPKSEEKLSELLAQNAFSPCGAFSERTAGWEAPADHEGAPLCRRLNGADLLQLRTQSRVLPVAAIKEALEDRIAEFRSRMAQEPPPSERRRMREETKEELLPKALLKSERSRGCFIHSESLLIIDAATDARAEWFIDQLRTCFGEFKCTPLAFSKSPGELLQRIFLGEQLPGFSIGRECRMQDISDAKSIATWREFELTEPSIRRHVVDGMRLTHLGIVFDELLSCLMSEDGVISKLRFLEGDAVDRLDYEDPLARLDADFVLLTGTVSRMVDNLKKLLGGYA
ncbi:MAG: recombination-associated protein RdgC [Xanthomonadales bacterium]|nr:recombination-associated protein RdgC [Gammaproteobacteria bacterium]MBT8054031.1 recombination-associated protein RdgC [Gammaproteobacteria bacterium]NND57082.1 recombination-associated protein RdgC [Xanthomonadales bacterium]NNK51026.1 recombination-associated protein RdgC [Xanthomonadales bacterium]